MDKTLTINYQEYSNLDRLSISDRELLEAAIDATKGAYAPYSNYHVGAAVRLKNGIIMTGANQENAAYPSGLCAERTAIFAASAQHPDCRDYDAIAIVGRNAGGSLCAAMPCGACRQSLLEYELHHGHPIRVICFLEDGAVRIFPSISALLPFSFQL